GWWSPNIAMPFGRWVDFVVKVREDINNGIAQVWMDGTQIANYAGPVGYLLPGTSDYVKFGYYNWSPYATNRKVLMRQAAMVVDPTGSKYTQSDLRALIQ
ncbi:MAG TPA: heparin lyase I family protein, partial [Burkholderiales bacterium]|nr:heparin lyase I family protein [Burkholderiales bacterium]